MMFSQSPWLMTPATWPQLPSPLLNNATSSISYEISRNLGS
jgi:hypothetical protein